MKPSLSLASPFLALLLALAVPAHAADGGATKAEAEAMVKKGVAYLKANGADKFFDEINKHNAQWINKDLYLVAYGMDGTAHAHGANSKMIGKNLIDIKDVDGKAFVKERVDLAKAKGAFWQKYKFVNPETKAIEPKIVYCERVDETVVCGGIYE
jgi:cytochrome c